VQKLVEIYHKDHILLSYMFSITRQKRNFL